MEAQPKERPKTPQGHYHAEAYCLMWYACDACGHRERLWNSRDGITPFGTACPSCGQPTLNHADFQLDSYAPAHKPAHGQRIWVSMTAERAEFIAKERVKAAQARGPLTMTADRLKSLVASIYDDGQTPDLMLVGYPQETPETQTAINMPAELHPATASLVARFAGALASKLREAEIKHGYQADWQDGNWLDECRADLVSHLVKGDPRDVAAYCAFLWHHEASTTPDDEPAMIYDFDEGEFVEHQSNVDGIHKLYFWPKPATEKTHDYPACAIYRGGKCTCD